MGIYICALIVNAYDLLRESLLDQGKNRRLLWSQKKRDPLTINTQLRWS
jgi:hypothetical protein